MLLALILLIPNVLEKFLERANNHRNMAIYGILHDIYFKRNLIYFSLFILYLYSLYNLMYYGLIFVFLSITAYLYTYFRWRFIFM
jgi:hypothetical protein